MNTLNTHQRLLPFGVSAKVAYAPASGSAASVNSYKAGGSAVTEGFTAATAVGTAAAPFSQTAVMGRSATHYQVTAAPIDGLTVGADYVEWSGVKVLLQSLNQVHIMLLTLQDQYLLVTQKVI